MLNKINLGPKLIGGFLIVAVIAGIIGVFGIVNMKTIDDADTFLYEKETVPTGLSGNLGINAMGARVYVLYLYVNISNNNFAEAEKTIGNIKNEFEKLEKIFPEFEKVLFSKEDEEKFNNFTANYQKYKEEAKKYIEFAQDRNLEEMKKMLQGNFAVLGKGLRTEAEGLIEFNIAGAKETAENNTKTYEESSFIMEMVIVISVIIAVLLGLVLTRAIIRPLNSVVAMADKISVGDLNQEKLVLKTKDEIGSLAESFNKMIDSIKEKAALLEKVADNDLTIDVKLASDKDNLGISMTKMVTSLNEVLGMVNSSVEQVSSGAGQVSAASQQLSQGASEQASTLEEITSSITEISSQAQLNAANSTQANAIAKQSMENAEKGNNQMAELVTAMASINKSAEDIKKIVKAIDDIAFQINLLALNANVEAARAGKYGKGFAVVAEEVRNLAGRSSKSVQETNQMVEVAIKNIGMGSALVEATSKQLNDIVTGASKVADLVEEITVASKEQAQGLDQINVGLGQIDQVTQANTSSAEESASASEELASQGQQLKAMVARFKLAKADGKGKVANLSQDLIQKLIHDELAKQEKSAHMERLHVINEQKKTAVAPRQTAQKSGPSNGDGRGGQHHMVRPE